MTLIKAKRWRIEVHDNFFRGPYAVTVEPVAYISKEEFREHARHFRRFFMNLDRKWRWIRLFADQREAKNFAAGLTKMLGGLAYADGGHLCLVTPREGEGVR